MKSIYTSLLLAAFTMSCGILSNKDDAEEDPTTDLRKPEERDGWNETPPNESMTKATEGTFDTLPTTATKSFQISGKGDFAMDNGFMIRVGDGATSSPISITVTQKNPASLFDVSPERFQLYKIDASAAFTKDVTVYFPNLGTAREQGSHTSDISIFRISHKGFEVQPLAGSNLSVTPQTLSVQTKDFSYWGIELPPQSALEPDLGPMKTIEKSLGTSIKWPIRFPESSVRTLDAPYFDQGATGGCWSAAFSMFIAAYRPKTPHYRIWDNLNFFNIGIADDEGFSFTWHYFFSNAKTYLGTATSQKIERSAWSGANALGMYEYMLRMISEGRPVLFGMPDHAVLVVGFDGDKLVTHDPNKGKPYFLWDFAPLMQKYGGKDTRFNYLFVAENPLKGIESDAPKDERRVTLNIRNNYTPGSGIQPGGLIFKKPSKPFFAEPPKSFQWTSDGYIIGDGQGEKATITTEESLFLEVELANTWAQKEQSVKVGYQIKSVATGETFTGHSQDISLAPGELKDDLKLAWDDSAVPLKDAKSGRYELNIFSESTDGEVLEWISVYFDVKEVEPTSDKDEEPTPPTNDGQTCREYSASFSTTSNLQTSEETCNFNETNFQFTCNGSVTTNLNGTNIQQNFTRVTTYGSIEDFIAEGKIGVERKKTIQYSTTAGGPIPASSETTNYTYDSKGHLTKVVITASSQQTSTYTQWDATGRPLVGQRTTAICSGAAISFAYESQSMEVSYSGGTGVNCAPEKVVTSFNDKGVPTNTAATASGTNLNVVYNHQKFTEVCH